MQAGLAHLSTCSRSSSIAAGQGHLTIAFCRRAANTCQAQYHHACDKSICLVPQRSACSAECVIQISALGPLPCLWRLTLLTCASCQLYPAPSLVRELTSEGLPFSGGKRDSSVCSTCSEDCSSSAEVGSAESALCHLCGRPDVINMPSRSKISAPPIPTATAKAILCASPPLSVPQSLCQRVFSMPHFAASSMGSFSSELLVDPYWILELVLPCCRDPNARILVRKSSGLPGRSEGR
jgi:hypothetical protein